jgi:hypothetical protein
MPHKLLKYVDQQEAVFHHGRRDLQKKPDRRLQKLRASLLSNH